MFLVCSNIDKPSKPTNLRVTDVWKDYIGVSWEPPLKDGGSPVTGYTLEQRDALNAAGYQFVATVNDSQTVYQVGTNFGHLLYL